MQTLMILCGAVGFCVFAWGIYAVLAHRDRRKHADRRASLRLPTPGRRMSDLITLPHDELRRQ